jgi:hypothetical protein
LFGLSVKDDLLQKTFEWNRRVRNNDYIIVGKFIVIVIISLLMSPLLKHRPSLWITHKKAITYHAGPVRVGG